MRRIHLRKRSRSAARLTLDLRTPAGRRLPY